MKETEDATDIAFGEDCSWDFNENRLIQWSSVFFQARQPIQMKDVASVLEFGSARNLLKMIVENYGIRHVGVDVNGEDYTPDSVATISSFECDEVFDMVCAFQVLEHNPIEEIPGLLAKMASHSSKYVYLSLPYSGRFLSFAVNFNLPKFQIRKQFCWTWPRWKPNVRPVDEYKLRPDRYNPHWWEVGDKICSKERMVNLFSQAGLGVVKEMHNPLFPYHIFYLLEKEATA